MAYTQLFKWVTHGQNVCPKCQALSGQIRPMGAWQLSAGFHKNCHCTLDAVGQSELLGTLPVIYLTMADFPITKYMNLFNPVPSVKPPLAYPLCPFMPTATQMMWDPFYWLPVASDPYLTLIVPVNVVAPPAPTPTPQPKQAPHWDPTNKRPYIIN